MNMENTNRKRVPLSTNKWIGLLLLLTIPLVNVYFLIYWAFVQKVSYTRRNFARAVIIWSIIFILVAILAIIIFQPDFQKVAETFKEINKVLQVEESFSDAL